MSVTNQYGYNNINPNQYNSSQSSSNQISPSQVAQMTQRQSSQNMSLEELQRQQVLNYDDFQATARIEKISSKKPSAVLAFLGIFLIALGVLFPTIESLANGEVVDDGYTEFRETEPSTQTTPQPVVENVVCSLEKLNNPNGCDEIITATYVFQDKILKSYTREYLLRQSEGVTETPSELASYLTALEPFLAQEITGYKMTLQQVTNGSITTVSVDYDLLDYATIPASHQTNYRFTVPFQATATMEEVKAGMATEGYTCK